MMIFSNAPSFVYGATDGTITTFAIISGIMGASLSPTIVLILGISNVLADGFSMAASNYLSERTRDSVEGNGAEKHIALQSASVTFFSFVLVGSIPLAPFIFSLMINLPESQQFGLSIICTTLVFILIGLFRAKVAKQSYIQGVLETVLVGGIAASIAFVVGYLLKGISV